MMRLRMLVLVLPVGLHWGPDASEAHARRRGIPIIFGHAEEIAYCGELPHSVGSQLAQELGTTILSVGFKYDRFHVYYADLWTWNGEMVIYAGDSYWKPTQSEWHELLGKSPEEKYGKPFSYRAPLGLGILLTGASILYMRRQYFPSEEDRWKRLFSDPRYANQVQTLFGGEESARLATKYDDARLESAVAALQAIGIEASQARKNLRKMADAIVQTNGAQIDEVIAAADELAQQGNGQEAVELLVELAQVVPANDPRYSHVATALRAAQDQIESEPIQSMSYV